MSGRAEARAEPAPERLESWLDRERARVDSVLESLAREVPEALPPRLAEAVGYALSTRGKRLRPILCVAAFRAATGSERVPEAAYRLACSLEIVHTYSLVHDDLPCMDDDDLRRGRPTVHRVHGPATAVIAGAVLLPLAVRVLLAAARDLGLERAAGARLAAELCRAAGAEGMVGGQLRDLEGEQRVVTGEELEAIHRAKTGALLTASLRLGALAAGADDRFLAAITRYGAAVGLAFQITDDVLDVAGSTQALGKPAGRDQVLRKASYPSLYGLETAREMAHQRAEEAQAALRGISAPDLVALADYIVQRES